MKHEDQKDSKTGVDGLKDVKAGSAETFGKQKPLVVMMEHYDAPHTPDRIPLLHDSHDVHPG